MATITRVELVDDLDGSSGDETITFGLDNKTYEIDLSHSNAELLRDALAKFIDAGRRVGSLNGGRPRRLSIPNPDSRKPAGIDKAQRDAVRRWANENGYSVGDRGRIPQNVFDAFQQAHA